jgi:hypothetical protein
LDGVRLESLRLRDGVFITARQVGQEFGVEEYATRSPVERPSFRGW